MRRSRWLAGLTVLVAACSGAADTTTTTPRTTTTAATATTAASVRTLTGTIALSEVFRLGRPIDEPCQGDSGYDDMRAGAQVVISSADGVPIATGQLGQGEWGRRSEAGLDVCILSFGVEVPDAEPFYIIELSNRGELTYSLGDLNDVDWNLELSLGS